MKSKLCRVGLAGAFVALLGGSVIQALGGSSGRSAGSVDSWGTDDAYIGYRYAQNLVEGNGLVFNRGERTEAYSNFLHVLMTAPGFWVTNTNGIYFFSLALNLVLAGAALGIFVRHLLQQSGEARALAGAWLFACCLPLWVANASRMETPLVLLISLALWFAAERAVLEPSPKAVTALAVLMILSVLARADGFIMPGVAILYLLLKRRYRAAATCAGSLLVAGGAYEGWRYHYYGYPLPNSYYVKVAGPLTTRIANASDQLSEAEIFEGLLGLLLAWAFDLIDILRKSASSLRRLADQLRFDLLFAGVWLAYWFYIGGDHFWDRFLIILYPLGIFALMKYLPEDAGAKILPFLAALMLALEVIPPFDRDPRFDLNFHKYDVWVMTGKFLGQNYPGKTLATGALGKIGLFSGLYTEDILGLGDPVIAHRPVSTATFDPGHMKFDPDYTLGRRPDLIANWILPSGDLYYGLTRAKYQRAGYHVEYLMNTGKEFPAVPYVKVKGMDNAAIDKWVSQGYDFALLTRN